MGGLITDSTRDARRLVFRLFAQTSLESRARAEKGITKTDNAQWALTLGKFGWRVMTFEECTVHCPEWLALYLGGSLKSQDYYRSLGLFFATL